MKTRYAALGFGLLLVASAVDAQQLIQKLIAGTGNSTGTAAVQIFSAPGAGLTNYITSAQFANTGATTSLAQIVAGPSNTVLATTINPAGGGSNIATVPGVPLSGSANLSVGCIFGSSSTTQYCTLEGYVGPAQ